MLMKQMLLPPVDPITLSSIVVALQGSAKQLKTPKHPRRQIIAKIFTQNIMIVRILCPYCPRKKATFRDHLSPIPGCFAALVQHVCLKITSQTMAPRVMDDLGEWPFALFLQKHPSPYFQTLGLKSKQDFIQPH